MKEALYLSSNQNPKIKQVIHLRDRKERDSSSLFLIEGYRELLRAVDQGWSIESLFICPQFFLGVNENALIQRIVQNQVNYYDCSPQLFEKISYRDRPDGLIAIAYQKKLKLTDLDLILKKKKSPLFVVAEAIEKPGNLGTILRSADGVGVDAVILADPCTDLYNPNVVRASVGTLFTVPTIQSDGKSVLNWLKTNQIKVVAATPHTNNLFTKTDFTVPLAIAIGTEQLGLSSLWMDNADLQVKIPMEGVADSLNVAMATTLLLYEAHRQRHG